MGTLSTDYNPFMAPRLSSAHRALPLVLIFGLSCGDEPSTPSTPAPLELRLVSGTEQTGTVNTTLAQPVIVQALRNGAPQSGIRVRFSAGDASNRLEPALATTDGDGFASSVWTLGTVAGDLDVTASVETVDSPEALPENQIVATAVALPDAPARLTVVSGDNQEGPTSVPLSRPVVVRVEDQYGNPVGDVPVSTQVLEGDSRIRLSAESGPEGTISLTWTMGSSEGANRAEIRADGLSLTIAADAFAPRLIIVNGDDQIGPPQARINVNPRVRLVDRNNTPRRDVEVTFSIVEGGGQILGSRVRTNDVGEASIAWVLGPEPGVNRLRAQVGGGSILDPRRVDFVALAQRPEFNIEFLFVDREPSFEVREAFNDAAERWESVITGDLPAVDFRSAPVTDCQVSEPIAERIDDLLITVKIRNISAAGSAGLCILREGSQLPVVSLMNINPSQLDSLRLRELVTHEIGHALGVGTGPRWNNFLVDAVCRTNPINRDADTHFVGPRAIDVNQTTTWRKQRPQPLQQIALPAGKCFEVVVTSQQLDVGV
ncbi:MAG: hypothetical protein AAF449_19825, partial [Myxococcota bacterium]